MNRISAYLLISILSIGLFSCEMAKKVRQSDPLDTKIGFTKSDFDKYIIKNPKSLDEARKSARENNKAGSIPKTTNLDLKPIKPITNKDLLNGYRNVSFSVTDEIPLKDVLIELGRIAKIDVELDPNINGGIVISAHDKPLGEIIERISRLGNLRYEFRNGVLRFERDIPYSKSYFVDYLTEGSNMWSEVESNVKEILTNQRSTSSSFRSASGSDNIPQSSVTINKSAGILSVYSSQKQHSAIEDYLEDVRKTASAQVLIEAKVVEVTLDDEFKTGIDWDLTGVSPGTGAKTSGGFSAIGSTSSTSAVSFVINGDIGLSVSALEKFGSTRTLSSPRVHAINNRKSILNFTNKLVYFTVENNNITNTVNNAISNQLTVTSTKQEENVGVELSIVPSINLDTNEVTLQIKPKITVVSGQVIDPASPRDQDTNEIIFENKVPVIQTREIDTVAKIMSGNAIVIGGLMEESTSSQDYGVPFLQRIPFLGYLFKSSSKISTVTETVIFIKATIVNSSTVTDKTDREIQEKFDTNRRKFF